MISQQTRPGTITLIATNDFGATHRYDLLPDNGVFVGSSSNCGLQLHDDGLNDIHCRIAVEGGKLRVQDWMSLTGTRVNGNEISSETEFHRGDRIQIGRHQIVAADSQRNDEPIVCRADEIEDRGVDAASAEVEPQAESKQQESATLRCEDPPCDGPTQGSVLSGAAVQQASARRSSGPQQPPTMDLDNDFFKFEEEETYDRETVALLHAEIEDLQAALAQRDADGLYERSDQSHHRGRTVAVSEVSDDVLQRMQDLIDEANRSDERVAILEEMLFASEEASRSEKEERNQLEAWVGDIEKRIGQREDEHLAEIEALRQRLEESSLQQERLQRQLRQAASGGSAPKQYEETLEQLQKSNKDLQDQLDESHKKCFHLEQRIEQLSGENERVIREERAEIAKEQAKISRLRFDLSSKLADFEELPKSENTADKETAHRIQTLREHLREIHEQEKREEKEASLATRLAKLWKRVEY